jgi:hypothetical protein
MNKCFKPFFVIAILATFGVANAQETGVQAEAAPAIEAAPAVEATAPVAEAVPAVETAAPVEAIQPSIEESAEASVPQTENVVKPKKKKVEFAMVDFPANFEIQAKKIMPVDSENWPDNNLDGWWGRANLMVVTESENFKGKIHLRMYPSEFVSKTKVNPDPNDSKKTDTYSDRDSISIYEAWAWHRGDYFNFKIGRWGNTTRFGSQTFGGYLDAKRNLDVVKDYTRRAEGFMSVYNPENAIQFGFHNASEDISLDLSFISMDNYLNKGDLRVNLRFEDLADIDGLNLGIGYRSNIFDEVYSKFDDVTHTVAIGGSLPLLTDVGFLKRMNLFVEAALIGLDDQPGKINDDCRRASQRDQTCRADKGGAVHASDKPILGGLEMELYRSFNKIVIEAEYDTHRKNNGTKENVKDVLGSIYVQKQLNDRFTINLGLQSENNTKDFSFAGRLQGRIN